jgi:hypothetical protein
VDWKEFVITLYPRPKAGFTSILRTFSSEMTMAVATEIMEATMRKDATAMLQKEIMLLRFPMLNI